MTGMEVCLGDIVTIGRGSSPRPIKDKKYFKDGSIPWVKIADATASGKYIIQTKQFVNEYGASFSRHLKKGSLIISASGTLGTPYFLGVDACIHDGWLYFSDYAGVEPEWLYYKLMTLKEYFNGISYGAAIQNINTDIVRETKIFLPDLEIQTKQVQILKSIDDLSKTYEDKIRIYESVLAELYNSWFINFKFPNHEQVEFIDGIPEGWVKKTIFACYEILSGGTPKTTNPLYWENGKIPFFTPKDATDSYFVNETEKYITEDGLSKCNSKLYDEKTIFITARGTVGKTAIPMRPMAMNQSCYALKPKDGLCFYYSFLNIEDAINKIKQNANGGVFDAIVVDTFKQIDVLVPHMEIQVQFENLVQPMFEQIKNLLKQNEHLLELKHTLLPRLMSGELDVSKLSTIE